MNFRSLIAMLVFAIPSATAFSQTIRIEPGPKFESYTNEELRRRVWQLERAVARLQDQIFQLAMDKNAAGNSQGTANEPVFWTCSIQAFATTHVASGPTKAAALAQVLKKCSDASSAIHCKEADAKCGKD